LPDNNHPGEHGMADEKDSGKFESPDELDFDATVQLNIGKDGNIVSSVGSREITPDDFEKTIDGILGINEMLESMPQGNADMKTVTLASDEINFDEINADINALSEDLTPEAPELADSEPEEEHNEFLEPKKEDLYNGLPLLVGEEDDEPSADNSTDELNLGIDLDEDFNVEEKENEAPVIELTEEMLDNSEFPETELTKSFDVEAGDTVIETPELTETERHVISGATAAIRDISDEDETIDDTLSPPIAPVSQPPAAASGGSSAFPAFLGILGIAIGGFGAWMAFEATNQIDDLKRQIQSLSPSAMAKKNQEIADIQQRLAKIERRLTGTPTVEAAAPLMSAGNETAVKEEKPSALSSPAKPTIKAITPQTEIASAQPAAKSSAKTGSGEWVINLSSHTTEAQAKREQERLQKLGLNADISTATVKDKTWYRIRINNFTTKDEARAQLNDVKERSGIKDAWISRK